MRTAIGIDIGGTKTRAARIDSGGRMFAHQSRPTSPNAPDALAGLLSSLDALKDASSSCVGIGVPGRVDAVSGRIMSGGFVDLSGLGLAAQVTAHCGLPCFCGNDAAIALIAEARIGAARGVSDAVMLTIGTGIGGAIIAGGRLFHGGGTAGQLGHIAVAADGPLCNCGRRGCLENESSGTALQRHAKAAGFAEGTGIEELLDSGSPQARRVIAAWAAPLRAGLDSLAAAFAPQVIVLGGGLGHAACRALARFPPLSPWFQYELVPAELGDEAGVIGAGLAALEHFA